MKKNAVQTIIFNFLFLVISQFFFVSSSHASIARELFTGAEPMAMGDAYIAIAEDENAVFYNPAGVASYTGMKIHYLTGELAVSDDDLSLVDSIKSLKNPSGSTLNSLMGKNVYAQGRASASLLVPHFGVTAFYDAQGALYAANQAFPKIEFGYQRTSGVQAAFGFSTKTGRKRGKGKRNEEFMNEWRFGLGAKYLTRTGGYTLLGASQLFSLDKAAILDLMGGKGSGYGFDLGMQRLQRMTKEMAFHFGMAFQNIGDIQFPNGPDAVKGNLGIGTGLSYRLGIVNATFAYDVRHLTRSDDWKKKQHMGIRIGLPLIDLYGGINQAYLTYGLGFDIWLLRITGLSYAQETGSYVYQDPERRYALKIDFKVGL